MQITIVGLGPGDPSDLTRDAWEVLQAASEVYLRTREHPTVAALPEGLAVHTFDHLYEAEVEFPRVYEAIADQVLELARREQGVVYAVPGHPWVGEASTVLICDAAAEEGIPVRVVGGVSFLEPVLQAVGVDAMDGLQVMDAMLLAASHHPQVLADRNLVLAQCYSRQLASDVKLTLLSLYPDEHPVTVVRAAGTSSQELHTTRLFELDRSESFDHLTTVFVPAMKHAASYEALQEVVAHLRAPEGCPWDQEQTHQSLRTGLLEETYELLAALDAEDLPKMQEELGDMLLQLMLHIQIGSEEGEFRLPDVITGIVDKLVRRHPHVFGDLLLDEVSEVLSSWEAIKREERIETGSGDGLLNGLPLTLPALAQAQAYQRRLARVGLDVLDMLDVDPEEILAMEAILVGAYGADEDSAAVGLRLLMMAEIARRKGIDLEDTLRAANAWLASRAGDEQ
jgi:tetrapyrrole methylase family protein/MazG family protein